MGPMPRIRDFIETVEGLIFSVVSYHHEGVCNAVLRYYQSPDGDRLRGNERYRKVSSTSASFDILEKDFPDYVYREGLKLQGVPFERIKRIYRPEERLGEICEDAKSPLEEKVAALSDIFRDIPQMRKGITGSVLVGLNGPSSDIDFVIYGISNHKKARGMFEMSAGGKLRELAEKEWRRSYEKRFSGHETLDFEEYLWHERRKWHKGTIDGTIFDILLVRTRDEIGHPPMRYERKEKIKIECTVTDASLAFDSPSIYRVECDDERIDEVLSYTHTFAGQAFEGERIEACGFFEEAADGRCRVSVGSTREAPGEYIKVMS